MTDKAERDALVATLRELRDTGDVSDWRAMETALTAAIEALAAPAEGGQGEAMELTKCCGREECGGECGNEWRGTEWVRKAAQPAASVDVDALKGIASNLNDIAAGLFNVHRFRAQQISGLAAQLSGLIDSAGGAKVYQCPRCSTSMEVDPTAKPAPQPAEGDGASPTTVRFIDGGIVQMDRADYDKLTRPSAAAAVDDAMVERALAAYAQSRGTYEGEGPADADDMRAALTAALAQQEPRHDALADADSASA